MKHGPIALIDRELPVVGLAPKDALYEKIVVEPPRGEGARRASSSPSSRTRETPR